MSVRLLTQWRFNDIQLDHLEKYELYIKGEFVEIIRGHNIEEADTRVHEKYPHLTDDDYELKEKAEKVNYYNVNVL